MLIAVVFFHMVPCKQIEKSVWRNKVKSQNKLTVKCTFFVKAISQKAPFRHFFRKINSIKTVQGVPGVRGYCKTLTETVFVRILPRRERNLDNSATMAVNVIYWERWEQNTEKKSTFYEMSHGYTRCEINSRGTQVFIFFLIHHTCIHEMRN